jgi:hypothetical protein
LLGFPTRYDLDGFLKEHEVWANYSLDDFRQEMQDLAQLGF